MAALKLEPITLKAVDKIIRNSSSSNSKSIKAI
jgi:hypothetical protein